MEGELIGVGGLAGAGIVLALVEVLRRTVGEDIIKDRFTPGLAILIAIGWNSLVKLDAVPTEETTWLGTVLLGILTGLAASGLYSGGRAIAGR
jgi:4-amino-4-deoxy-L-arabinose transferase-like glycosyltransferase